MRGRCVIMTRRHCGACKLKMPKSKCPKCFVLCLFSTLPFFLNFQLPENRWKRTKNGWTKTRKREPKTHKKWKYAHLLSNCTHPAGSQLSKPTHTKAVWKRYGNKKYMVPGPGCPLRRPKWGRTPGTEMETNWKRKRKQIKCFVFRFHGLLAPRQKWKKWKNLFQNQLRP